MRVDMNNAKKAKKQNDDKSIKGLIRNIWKKLMTREIITYVIFGILTTIVNFTTFHIFCNILNIEDLTANAIAWVIAVAFAYIVNALWVFRSKYISVSNEVKKVIRFVLARISSFIIEQAGLIVFVKWLNFNNLIVKAVLAIIVIIINYVFSKLFVFTKKKS